MSVIVQAGIMTFTEELEAPPEVFEGLSFEIAEILDKISPTVGEVRSILVVTPFKGCQMVLRKHEVEAIQQALLNWLNTGYFDLEG